MRFSRRILVFCLTGFLFVLATQSGVAQANTATNAAEEIGVPKLVPPYAELPPTFWEQHGLKTIFISVAGLVILGAIVWLLRRSKPVIVVSPEVQAQRALEALRPKAENGAVLSQVSGILRDYFRTTFDLPPDELTTTEFCRMLGSHETVGAELAAKISDFLRHCDERKFSTLAAEPLNAVTVALELVALGEARRAQFAGSAGILPANSSTPRDETRRQDAGAPRS